MGAYLVEQGKTGKGQRGSIVLAAYEKDVPIFCPAFSDCSAGFGLVAHQHARQDKPKVSIDSAKDFHELTQLKIANPTTGLLMIGGGVPKNFAQDIVVAAEILGMDAPMHKYAMQITVADVRDGACSSHAEGSQFVGQGRHYLRADGVQRSHSGVAADRRLCLPQECTCAARATPLGAAAGAGYGLKADTLPTGLLTVVLKWQAELFLFYSFAPRMGILRGIPQWL